MKKFQIIFLALFCFCNVALAQYDPAGGEPGSKAVNVNSSRITGWAENATVSRGWVDISDTSQGKVVLGNPPDVASKADRFCMSLGDGGSVTLEFSSALTNFDGDDFAVFENGFKYPDGYFLELAFVEVSTDGKSYHRFPSVSLIDTIKQKDNGSGLDPTKLNNFAGKHQALYGTPFDLEELRDSLKGGVDSIRFIRLVDVVGNLNDSFARYDSRGNKINDPWPTPFASGGFDLDAVAILGGVADIEEPIAQTGIYPNPVKVNGQIRSLNGDLNFELFTPNGQKVMDELLTESGTEIGELGAGIYIARLSNSNYTWTNRLFVVH